MSVTLELKADQLIKKFDSLTAEVQQAMIDELRVTGFMIETAYKIGVPTVTARLKTSIHTEHSDLTSFSYSDMNGNTYNGSLGYKLDRTQVIVGTNVEYASKIEYRGGKGGRGIGALLTAFEAETKGLPQRLAELIK
jgi:phage gpG-like protein